jgi:pilus assembly protein CpaB
MILVASVVAGLVAAAAAWAFLGGVQDRANDDARLVKVLILKEAVTRGTTGDQAIDRGLVGEETVPQRLRSPSAVSDVDVLRGKVAATDLVAGQIVGDGFFVEPRAVTTSFAQRIPSGQVAISIQVDAVHGVANLIAPGDKVNLLVPSPEGMRTLFQNIDVIAVGTTAAPRPGEVAPAAGAGSGLITFAVPPLAAERIAQAASTSASGLYLALVPPDNQPVTLPPISPGTLFQGTLTPNG